MPAPSALHLNRRPGASPVDQGLGDQNSDQKESWVEISSQPSSSSLSSASIDELYTELSSTNPLLNSRRRRRKRRSQSGNEASRAKPLITPSTTGSSQEEYDESESEEDHLVTTLTGTHHAQLHDDSAEELERSPSSYAAPSATNSFTPQPNAFSHPPPSRLGYRQVNASQPSSHTQRRPSYTRPRAMQPTPNSIYSNLDQADHDAALRASLSTLLSCAAAARALPKESERNRVTTTPSNYNRIEPGTMRIIPESMIASMDPENLSPLQRLDSPPSLAKDELKGPRPFPSGASKSSKDYRAAAKKARSAWSLDEVLSPTLLTWVVSAGVVVLVSAISFSAGYAIGKEVGKAEAGFGDSSTCGKEAVKGGLRRLRWGTSAAATSVRV
ncbi:MAG: hypothetical protein M1829_000806 [Trizodia sp. TS-e1964]|nr:MAG: hypothetical protein M1829_000806 [Trizodia sp. TS-e1964]